MAIPELFHAESLYDPEQWYVHELLEVDAERLVAVCDTQELAASPIVAAQRPWPNQPKHVPGMVMVQITGTLGNLHAVFGLGLRMSEGWIGYGTNILDAKFRGLGRIGPPLRCQLEAEALRRIEGALFVTYRLRLEQDGKAIYTGRQRAVWRSPAAEPETAG